MSERPLRTSRPLAAFLLGLAGTLLILIGFWTGLDPRTELRALDMRFGLTDAALPDNILHVDIDDGSLDSVGRWPWPRESIRAATGSRKNPLRRSPWGCLSAQRSPTLPAGRRPR